MYHHSTIQTAVRHEELKEQQKRAARARQAEEAQNRKPEKAASVIRLITQIVTAVK